MNKKTGLRIDGRRFDDNVEDKFLPFLEQHMSKDFDMGGNNDLKKVFHGYIKKTYELFLQEDEIEKILKKLEI